MSGYTIDGKTVSDRYACPNIFSFCAFMAAAVAAKRGGKASDYIAECADFEAEVVGRRLTIEDPLPDDYDWTVSAARESAEAMMEYDA